MASCGTCTSSHQLLVGVAISRMDRANKQSAATCSSYTIPRFRPRDFQHRTFPFLNSSSCFERCSFLANGIHRLHRRRNDISNVKRRNVTGDVRPSSSSFFRFVRPPRLDVRRRSWRSNTCLASQLRPPSCRSSATCTCLGFDSGAHLFLAHVPRHVSFAIHRHQSEECVFGVFPTRASTRFDHGLVLSATSHGVSQLRGELRGASVRGRLFHVRLARVLSIHVVRFGAQHRRHRHEARDDDACRHRRRSSHEWPCRTQPGLLFKPFRSPFKPNRVGSSVPFRKGRAIETVLQPRKMSDMVVGMAVLCRTWICMWSTTNACNRMH